MKKIILYIGCCFFVLHIQAQKSRKEKREARNEKVNAVVKQEEEGLMVYKKHHIYGGTLNTDGYGIFFEKGIRQDRRKTSLIRIELAEKKHQKEDKLPLSQNSLGQVNTLIPYKLNNFYQFRIGYGYQYMLGSKGNKNGVEVSAVGVGGLSIGLAKPFLYDFGDSTGKKVTTTWTEYENNTKLVDIYGASGFSKGWNQLKIKPGAFLKAGLRFDYGRFNETVSAVDLGLFVEFYGSKIPQLYFQKEKNLFFGAYLSMLIGKRK
jgi:hypothetical protein